MTSPFGVAREGMEGSGEQFLVSEGDPKVCVEIKGVDVMITRIHFTVGGVNYITVELLRSDGVTPLPDQV